MKKCGSASRWSGLNKIVVYDKVRNHKLESYNWIVHLLTITIFVSVSWRVGLEVGSSGDRLTVCDR